MEFTSELFSILFRFESDGRRGKKKSHREWDGRFWNLDSLSSGLLFFVWGKAKKKQKKQKVNNSKHKRTLREREKRAIDVEDLRCASNLKQTRGNETNAGFPSFGRQDPSDCKTIGWRK